MKWLKIFFLLLFSSLSRGQSLTFNTYTPADGLIDASVQTIYQDKRGVLYFLTRDGFSSFDGQHFQNYSHYKNQPLSVVNDIIEDKNGRLLVSALSGIYYLNKNKLERDTTIFKSLKEPGHIVNTISGEKIILANSGVVVFNGSAISALYTTDDNNKKTPLLFDKAVAAGDWLIGASYLPEKSQYTLTLYNWKLQKTAAKEVADKPFDILHYHHTIYISVNNTWKQLNNAAIQQGLIAIEAPSFAPLATADKTIYHFYIDAQKKVWLFYTNKKVCVLDPYSRQVTCYTAVNGLPESASRLFQDAERNYWFTLTGKGVCKLVQSKVQVFSLPGSGIPAQAESVSISPEGIVAMKNGNTVHLIKGEKFSTETLTVKPGSSLVFSWNKKLWTLYSTGRLESTAGDTIQLASFTPGTKIISFRISFDKQNRLLIGGNYFAVIDPGLAYTTIELPYFTDNIIPGEENDYWCFARNGAVLRYTLDNNKINGGLVHTDKYFSARCGIQWNKDTFCIGTRNSGIVFTKTNGNTHKIIGTLGTEKGLSNNFLSGLIKLGDKKLLASTVAGLDIVHLQTPDTSVEQLFSRIGLFTGITSAVKSNDSTIIALSENGIPYHVNLGRTTQSVFNPSLFFNSMTVNGKEVVPGGTNVFAYNENNFSFSVSAPSFIDEKNIRFLFSLEGPNTTVLRNSRSADFEYSNLPPGKFSLTVTAIFPGDDPVSKTITYYFIIKKPFWKTTGFLISILALAGLVSYLIFKTMLRRKLLRQRIELEKQQAVALERTRIATDMHDDLGAGISTIKYLSQSAPFIPFEQQKQNNLKIAEQADELVDKMNDIIWAMNEKNDTLDNLIFYTKAWVANYTQQHGLQSHFTMPPVIESGIIRGEKRQHIFLCIKESVHNIIKHAAATNVWLTIETNRHKLILTIRDDGKGYDKKKTVSGNGLSNMQKRMKMVKGEIFTETGAGTTHRFTIPL